TRLRVMTYNIRYGSRGASRIVQIMNETQPDIVCLQETRPELPGPDPVPQMKYLLPDWHLARDGEVTTFSRYPIVAHRSHKMPSRTGRVVLETQIALEGRRLSVFNVHMSTAAVPTGGPTSARRSRFGMPIYTSATAAIRRRQTAILLGVTSQATSPQIVMGDFNNPPRGLIYRALKGRFQDAFRAAGWGWGYTFRSDLPLMRIDYIFLGPGVHAVRSFVPRVTASDHRPVVADITVP
ncbi:MAG TPA: endonuclease/exonuclease/phosphatase family protein, partial [Abditibacteriaceae bacterium]|nr:endonuclease/exonuclease/phosphatase family protein [Abditibacteriaceae bacterium]